MSEETKPKIILAERNPFFLRIIAISAIVMGIMGVLFFGSITVYLILDIDFSESLKQTYYNKDLLWLYLIAGVALHLALFVSGIAINRRSKHSLWLFPLCSVLLLIFAQAVDRNFFLAETILVVLLSAFLFAYRKIFQ